MKNKRNILMMLVVFLLVSLVPDMSLAQAKKEQDSILSRSNIPFNHKKLMKMQNPSLQITDKIDNPFLKEEYDRQRLKDSKIR